MDMTSKQIELKAPSGNGKSPKLEVLSSDATEERGIEYRVLVGRRDVKFVTVSEYAAMFFKEGDKDHEMAIELAKFWPPGDWDKGDVDENIEGDEYCFCSLTWSGPVPSPPVDGFLERVVESHSLVIVDKLSPRVRVVTWPEFPRQPLIYKFAAFPRDAQRISHEVKTYGLLSQNFHKHGGIVPTFVAHVQHNGNMIGFLLEHVSGHLSRDREEHDACHKALDELHALGIKHGQVRDANFLIRGKDDGSSFDPEDGPPKAIMLSLGQTARCNPKDQEAEHAKLE
ncbi:alpha-galactosidase a precursor [Ophiostoma piceae UAMH 11346]|uniref:Alpha-galactosidase a n=1 Tax=Ophiostoma piceae (strain UAMH 11346) TaxID=1262450 RepID=S3BTP9_OPHP1|nr:alpha-galactosidase a precursor [Ophiostoma piceae UAMH 11346]